MSSFPKWAAGLLAVGIAGGALVARLMTTSDDKRAPAARGGGRENLAPPSAPTSNPAIGPVADQIGLLQAQVAGLQQQVQEQSKARASTSPPSGVPEPQRKLHDDADDTLPIQVAYDAIFESQPMDPAWARREKQTISDFFSKSNLAGMRFDDVECRESMCRVRLHFDGDAPRSGFLSKIGSPPFDNGGFYRTDPETGAFALFTAREGRDLPSLDPEELAAAQ